MIKIFLVEDEAIVREGLRDNIPWEQYGYEFTGEAPDGEIALPMIRNIRPDVLITDIKMPFMDGLSLSRIVTSEIPGIRIIIISGFDDFEYAQQAISLGVERYLLKPITRNSLRKVLLEIREKIDAEQEQKNYLEKFRSEMQEYAQYSRRTFFEKLFSGIWSVEQIYEEAGKLSLELNSPSYNLAFITVQMDESGASAYSDSSADLEYLQEEILSMLLRNPDYIVFRWSINTYGILICGKMSDMEGFTTRISALVQKACEESRLKADWHAAFGIPVERISMLGECYKKVNQSMAYRFLVPDQHIFLAQDTCVSGSAQTGSGISQLDISKIEPAVIRSFLTEGKQDEAEEFSRGYLYSVRDAIASRLFRDYLLLNIRFTTLSFMESLNIHQEEFLRELKEKHLSEAMMQAEDVQNYMVDFLQTAIRLRDRENEDQGKKVLRRALSYIEEHYTEESLSLKTVSAEIGMNPSYFSGIFSQEMQMTFTEYVTSLRMELAKKLLRQNGMHTGEAALAVGYKDSHYFSFVFKKTTGCTPKEYRTR